MKKARWVVKKIGYPQPVHKVVVEVHAIEFVINDGSVHWDKAVTVGHGIVNKDCCHRISTHDDM